jgi:hypothetical protein
MSALARVAILAGATFLQASSVNSNELLVMRVSAYSPGALTIRLTTRTHAENRGLVVRAESADYYRSSEIQLDGDAAPATTILELRGLPSNIYEVTGVLIGSSGPRATVIRVAQVLPDRRGR